MLLLDGVALTDSGRPVLAPEEQQRQMRAAALPNGARLLCSAVGVYEPAKVRAG